MCLLCLASKVWDDDSLENKHFPKVMPNVSTREMNHLEQAMTEFLDFNLLVKGSEYAKFYFILRSLSLSLEKQSEPLSEFENEKRNKKSEKEEWGQFPLQAPITVARMLEL